MPRYFLFVCLAMLCLLVSCGGSEASTAAAKMCDCGKKLVEPAKAMGGFSQATTTEDRKKMVGEAAAATNDMFSCLGGEEAFKALKEGTGATESLKREHENKVNETMQKKCPEVLQALTTLKEVPFE